MAENTIWSLLYIQVGIRKRINSGVVDKVSTVCGVKVKNKCNYVTLCVELYERVLASDESALQTQIIILCEMKN